MKTPQEYREKVKQVKTLELPSGFEVVIQAVPTLIILDLVNKADEADIDLDKYMTKHFAEALSLVIPSSVLRPKMLPVRETGQEIAKDALYVDELHIGDLNFLFAEIVKLSGISEKEIEKHQSFLEQRDRKGGSADGKDIRL